MGPERTSRPPEPARQEHATTTFFARPSCFIRVERRPRLYSPALERMATHDRRTSRQGVTNNLSIPAPLGVAPLPALCLPILPGR